MSAFWAVFLLCSLQTPSQGLGIMSSVSKVDVDGKCTEETGFIFFFFFFFETSSALSVSRPCSENQKLSRSIQQ